MNSSHVSGSAGHGRGGQVEAVLPPLGQAGRAGFGVEALVPYLPLAAVVPFGPVGYGSYQQCQSLPSNFGIDRKVFKDPCFPGLTLGQFLLGYTVFSSLLQPVCNPEVQGQSIAKLFGINFEDLNNLTQHFFREIDLGQKLKILGSMRKKYLKENPFCKNEVSDEFLITERAPNLISLALQKRIDASAANMVFVETESNTYLIVVYNQKKGILLQASNGAALQNESLSDAAQRFFIEELFLGGLDNDPLVRGVQDEAVDILTQNGGVGENWITLISRILLGKKIYINASATRLVEMKDNDFHESIRKINSRLEKISGFYGRAKSHLDGLPFSFFDPKVNLDSALQESALDRFEAAKSFVDGFLSCLGDNKFLIPETMQQRVFDKFSSAGMSFTQGNLSVLANVIKNGIMQLTQNTRVSAVSERGLQRLLEDANQNKGYGTSGTYFFAGIGFLQDYVQKASENEANIATFLRRLKRQAAGPVV